MKLGLLGHNKEAIPIIAEWYYNEWGNLPEGNSIEKARQNLQAYLNTDKIPLMVIAKNRNEILGTAQLKFREMSIYHDKEHWLGGVYVSENHRGKRIAEKIILEVISIAKKLAVKKLYLQTEELSGGLYARMGWEPVEKVNYRANTVLVMEKIIAG
jgi:GNAT superfamily N-acetyltransferase